jgi:hypothetical protein
MSRKSIAFAALGTLLALWLGGCSLGNRQLESISILPSSASGASATFSATGTFNTTPFMVAPLPVSWYLMGPAIDPPGPIYNLQAGNYVAQRCSQIPIKSAQDYTVIALAPTDPKAAISGSMPNQVFEDLVIAHSKTQEGGFVAATAALVCP